MFTPQYATNIAPYPQFRVGIQGAPNTGKTWSALSFPNPLVINYDNKLGAHTHRTDVKQLPFYDPNFITDVLKKVGKPPPRAGALVSWLRDEGHKLETDQTLIIDSWTMLVNAYHIELDANYPRDKKGEKDTYAYWRMVKQFASTICEYLKGLSCNVVVLCHETIERNDDGKPTGKNKLLMTGSFSDELAGHFTDWFRAVVDPTKDRPNNISPDVRYFWQTKGDATFDGGCSVPGIDKLIPAHYNSLVNEWKKYAAGNVAAVK